ncbi:unnamed protein product, partial [Hymenolepis diminuta]
MYNHMSMTDYSTATITKSTKSLVIISPAASDPKVLHAALVKIFLIQSVDSGNCTNQMSEPENQHSDWIQLTSEYIHEITYIH